MPTPEQLVMLAMVCCGLGAVVTAWRGSRTGWVPWVTVGVSVVSGLAVGVAAVGVLVHGPGEAAQFLRLPQVGFALRLHVDGLSAVFLLLAAGISIPAAVYSVPYLRHYGEAAGWRYHPPFLLFLAAMYGLVSTTDMMWFFFIFWQCMTLPGYALIRYDRERLEHRRAARRYLWMMQVACVATMVGAELLAAGGGSATGTNGLRYDFGTVSAHLPELLEQRPGWTTLAFGLFLVGFGIKMGMWPFGQYWLPEAHPAAPSPVSAMLSGVMIKTGVYGLLRYFLWLVPEDARDLFPLATWGGWVVLLGTVTLLTGTVQALRQESTKRLLAFSSMGQVGYILLGTGIAMVLLPRGGRWELLAAFGILGALLHVWNHGMFKALLFFNAGSMLYVTGTQDLNRLGGLLRILPWTGVTALVASLAIAGVPTLNGYVSKWAIYSSAFGAGREVWYLPLCGWVALFTSALTLAVYIKFYGVSFLARPGSWELGAIVRPVGLVGPVGTERSSVVAADVPWLMRAPQLFLAGLCVLFGLIPGLGLGVMVRALRTSPEGYGAVLAGALPEGNGLWVWEGPGSASLMAPLAVAVVLVLGLGLAVGLMRIGGSRRRTDTPWLCGYAVDAPIHHYRAHQFYGELKRWSAWAGGQEPREKGPGPSKEHP